MRTIRPRRCCAGARARRRKRLRRHVRGRARAFRSCPTLRRAGRRPELGDAERAGLGAAAARRLRVAVPALARDVVRRPALALAERRRGVRDPVAGARRDQQDRVQLRPQHGPELGRRGRLDAVHAGHVAALGHRRERRRHRRSLEPRRRRLLGCALPRCGRRPHRHLPRDLRLQPRAVVRRRRAAPRGDVRRRGRYDAVFTLDRLAIALEDAQATGRLRSARRSAPRSSARASCRSGRRGARGGGGPRPARSPTGWSPRRRRSRRSRTRRRDGRGRAAPRRARARRGRARGCAQRRPLGLVRPRRRRHARDAEQSGRLRLPRRGRPGRRLGRPPPPRLSRRRHRGAARNARLRARRRGRREPRGRAAAAGSGSRCARSTGSSGSTATSRTATRPCSPAPS